jgi:membrane protein required for colicin V production
MSWLDIVIVLVIAIPAFFGYRKGFLRKLLGIAGILFGFILALNFYPKLSDILSGIIKGNPTAVKILSFLLIIAVVFSLAVWLARFIANINSGTSLIDKILGIITGFIQGLIIASVLVVNLSSMGVIDQNTRTSSLLYPRIYNIAPSIFDRLVKIAPGLQNTYDEYKKILIPK